MINGNFISLEKWAREHFLLPIPHDTRWKYSYFKCILIASTWRVLAREPGCPGSQPAPFLTSCVIMSKLLNHAVLLYSYYKMKITPMVNG